MRVRPAARCIPSVPARGTLLAGFNPRFAPDAGRRELSSVVAGRCAAFRSDSAARPSLPRDFCAELRALRSLRVRPSGLIRIFSGEETVLFSAGASEVLKIMVVRYFHCFEEDLLSRGLDKLWSGWLNYIVGDIV